MRSLEWLAQRGKQQAQNPAPQQQTQPVQQQSAETQQPDSSFDDSVELSVAPPVN
jgi:hypothetical protein